MSKTGIFNSSIGRKFAMALSAIFLMIFLVQHLIINLSAVFSEDLFNQLSHFMGTNFLVQFIAQPILVFAVIFHFVMGMYLERKNRAARPIKYVKYNGAANASWMSRNMMISGLVILAFLVLHLIDFFIPEISYKYVEMNPEDPTRYYDHLLDKFRNPGRVLAYCVAFVLLALHLLHGFGSAFQSIGQNNQYLNRKMKLGTYYALLVPLGFIVTAIALYVKTLN